MGNLRQAAAMVQAADNVDKIFKAQGPATVDSKRAKGKDDVYQIDVQLSGGVVTILVPETAADEFSSCINGSNSDAEGPPSSNGVYNADDEIDSGRVDI